MSRHFDNWLKAYCDFTEHLEAPTNLHFFSGAQAIAGALRRQVWVDQGYFNWYPNQYVIIVAKPGIVNKSTSIGVAMDLLREVPGVHMGPSSVTWQALVQAMGAVCETFELNGEHHVQSCLSFVASELGTLVDFRNREMIDVLVDLWDGKTGSWEKMSKMHGTEAIVNPWISFIAGTTPAWLADNVPEGAVGGGFTSRCLFIYGREKRHLVAYPKKRLSSTHAATREKLIADLEKISMLKGEYILTPDAVAFGEEWYEKLWTQSGDHLRSPRFEGYLARKQTHLHKLSMILAAAQRDDLIITIDDLKLADALFSGLEDDMLVALNNVGRTKSGAQVEELTSYLMLNGPTSKADVFRYFSRNTSFQEINWIIDYGLTCGSFRIEQRGETVLLVPIYDLSDATRKQAS